MQIRWISENGPCSTVMPDVAYRVSVVGAAVEAASAGDGRSRAARPAARAAPDVGAAPAHPGRADRGATGSRSRAEGRARHAGQSDDLSDLTVRPSEHDRPDVAAARVVWHTWDPTRLVFLDEPGMTNNGMVGPSAGPASRTRRAPGGSSVSRRAAGDWPVFDGAIDGASFLAYIQILCPPCPGESSSPITSAHTKWPASATIERVGATLCYLPQSGPQSH